MTGAETLNREFGKLGVARPAIISIVFALAAAATPAAAAPPKSACELTYAGNIATYAMTCSEPGEPMFGGFATWRNIPIKFDQVDTSNTTVKFSNFLRLTPNTAASPFENNIEIGLYAEKTGKTTQSYGPSWTEFGNSGGKTKAIKAGVNPSTPDGRNHTYMLLRKPSGDQWDVLYDYNTVGTTTDQIKVIPGATNRIDIGMELLGQQYANVPVIADRMQFLDGNNTWRQIATKNTAKVVTLPACSTTNKPPKCINAKLTDATTFSEWTISKPRTATSSIAREHTEDAARGNKTVIYNGVDQQKLHSCMANDPNNCLRDVPGLLECVNTYSDCNTESITAESANIGQAAPEADAQSIRQRAAAAFRVDATNVNIVKTTSPDGAGHSGSIWEVHSNQTTPGLAVSHKKFKGFTAKYSALTGDFLEACWGAMC
ncbi:hypothetical protein ACFY9Q_16710 [Streptomyces sp. NPDC012389]|uniref:hypothetical protein n=1 Tax=Streptomyces sp. NPDC012389 TaxID=3364830 RepID=UPI0036E393C8